MFVERGLVLVQPYAERPVVDQGAAQAEPETVAGPVALKSVAGAVDWVGRAVLSLRTSYRTSASPYSSSSISGVNNFSLPADLKAFSRVRSVVAPK